MHTIVNSPGIRLPLALIYTGVTNNSEIWECLTAIVSIPNWHYRLITFGLDNMLLTIRDMLGITVKALGIACIVSLTALV
jgi:hypothetical protein